MFCKTDAFGVSAATGTTNFTDNVLKNNILARSRFVANDTRWTFYVNDLAGKYAQLMLGNTGDAVVGNGLVFHNNDVFGSIPGDESFVITNGGRNGTVAAQRVLSWYQTNRPAQFSSNREVDPLFVNAATNDYNLSASSPMIDAGVFVAKTVGAGSGTSIVVDDAGYFYDGYSIPGEVGDLIQLQGQTDTARVTGINYATKTLTLNQSLTWTSGLGVHLAYAGSSPDIGAYEYGLSTTTITTTPGGAEVRILVYPNPFNFSVNNTVKFENLMANSEVFVYSITGELVKNIQTAAATAEWDGRDNNGDKVSRGVYLLVNKGDTMRRGRLAVIN